MVLAIAVLAAAVLALALVCGALGLYVAALREDVGWLELNISALDNLLREHKGNTGGHVPGELRP